MHTLGTPARAPPPNDSDSKSKRDGYRGDEAADETGKDAKQECFSTELRFAAILTEKQRNQA
jgi:hypothetical protein